MMKKIISIAASVMLLFETFTICYADEEISLTVAAGEQMPVGTISDISINCNVAADKIEILRSYDDGVNFELEKTLDFSADLKTQTEYEEYDKQLKAAAYSADGTLIAESEPVTVTGMREKVVKQVWNESFDGTQIISGGDDLVYIAQDGARLFNDDGNYLQGALGNGGKIEIKPCSVEGSLGDSVMIQHPAQFNALWSKVDGDIAVFEMDYLFEDYPTERPLMEYKVMSGTSESWLPQGVYLKGRRITFGSSTTVATLNTWYKITAIINTETGDMTVLVNNKFLGRENVGKFDQTVRMSLDCSNFDGVMWFDNYNVRRITYTKASEKKFELVMPEIASAYIGENVRVGTDINGYKDAIGVVYYTSEDGVYYTTAEEATCEDTFVNLPIESEQQFIKAELLSKDGNMLAESNVGVIQAKSVLEIEKLWNIDFETNGFRIRDAGGSQGMISQVVTKSDGDDVRDKYDELLECHRGSEKNVMAIESHTDANGKTSKCVRLYSPDGSAANQFNKWAAKITKNIAVFSLDACVTNEAQNTSLLKVQVSTENGSIDVASVSVRNARAIFSDNGGNAVASVDFPQNVWQNIKIYVNIPESTIRCCIGNTLIGQFKISDKITKTDMITAGISGTDNAEVFFDNFVVSEIWEKPAIVSVEANENAPKKAIDIKLDSAVPTEIKNAVESIEIWDGDRKLVLSGYSLSEDGKTITVKSEHEYPSAVGIKCIVKFKDGESTFEFTLPSYDFDITNVSFNKTAIGRRITASVTNKTDSVKHIIMVCVSYNTNDEIIGTTVAETDVSPFTKNADIECVSAVSDAYTKVFFINSWDEGAVIKNAIYRSN